VDECKKDLEAKEQEEIQDHVIEMMSVASSSELTGLMPSIPESYDSAESYSDIIEIPVPENSDDYEITKDDKN